MTHTEVVSQFSYMVTTTRDWDQQSLDVFLASIPQGYAIIDTGCTTSVIGSETAEQLSEYMSAMGFPSPTPVTMPAVELRGFNGKTESTTRGLKWTVFLGKLQGQLTTYVIPGQTPFLLSRRVLESMGAVLNMQNLTLTSEKHGMRDEVLRQASNGHLLLPLCSPCPDLEVAACCATPDDEPNQEASMTTEDHSAKSSTMHAKQETCSHGRNKNNTKVRTPLDNKRSFQTVVKNTKGGVVDLEKYGKMLSEVFGTVVGEITYAAIAYKPKKERIPSYAGQVPLQCAVASLEPHGTMSVSPWRIRVPSEDRRPVSAMSVAIFAFRAAEGVYPDPPNTMVESPTSVEIGPDRMFLL